MRTGDYNKRTQIAERKTDIGTVKDFLMVGDNVLVEVDEISEVSEKRGVLLFLNTDKHNADNTIRSGIVRSLPHRFISRDDFGYGADWVNDIQIELEDQVWFTIVGSAESEKVVLNGKLYYIIPYKELILAKRDASKCCDNRSFESVVEDGGKLFEVVMLNGFCLVQPYMMPSNPHIKLPPKKSKDCFVSFCGEQNTKYYKDAFYDDDRVAVGDDVRITAFRGYLEDDVHLSFNGTEKYMVVQRRHMCYKY